MADRVTFTRSSGERIAKVVRIVEAGNRDASGIAQDARLQSPLPIRFCSWTSTWTIGSTATIQFWNTDITATANNVYLGVGGGDGWVARKGTTGWSLIGCDLTLQLGYSSASIQILGHNTASIAQWYSVYTCSTTV